MKTASSDLPTLSFLSPVDVQIERLAINLRYAANNPHDRKSLKPEQIIIFLEKAELLNTTKKTDYLKGPESRNLHFILRELNQSQADLKIILDSKYRVVIDAINKKLEEFTSHHSKAAIAEIAHLQNLPQLPKVSISRFIGETKFFDIITSKTSQQEPTSREAKIRSIKESLKANINPTTKLPDKPTDEQISDSIVENIELLKTYFGKKSYLFSDPSTDLLKQLTSPNLADRRHALNNMIFTDIDLGEKLVKSSRWHYGILEKLQIFDSSSLEEKTFTEISDILNCSFYSYPELDENATTELSNFKKLIESSPAIYQSTEKLRRLLTLTYNTPNNEYNSQFTNFLSDQILHLVEKKLENIDSYNQQKSELLKVIEEGSKIFEKQEQDFSNQHIKKEAVIVERFFDKYLGEYFPRYMDHTWKDVASETDEVPEQINKNATIEDIDLSLFFGNISSDIKDLYDLSNPTISPNANIYQSTLYNIISNRIHGTRLGQLMEIWRKDESENYQNPLQERSDKVYEIISETSRIFQRSPEQASYEIEIIRSFISEDKELCSNESTLPLYHVNNPSSPTSQESRALKSRSLLYSLTSGVLSHSAIVLVNEILERTEDLSNRPDLLMTMIFDNTIASDPDTSHTFNLMVQKNIPLPTTAEMHAMSTRERSVSGRNFSKLAKSFLFYRDDTTLVDYLLRTPNASLKKESIQEKNELLNYLKTEGLKENNDTILLGSIGYCIRNNDEQKDAMLNEILTKKEPLDLKDAKKQRNPLINKFLQKWSDHSPVLVLAIKHKLVKTFEILLNAGFDPRIHQRNTPNAFAIACKTQGTATLEHYLTAIRNKYGDQAAHQIVQETFIDEDGKTKSALTLAIEGKSYVDSIKFLIANGADFNKNHIRHFTTAIRNKQSGTFEFLLNLRPLNEEELEHVFDDVANKGDYAITESFKTYLNKTHPQMIAVLDQTLEERQKAFANQNIYEICEKYGEKTLKAFLHANPEYRISDNINTLDQYNRSPLYYALNKNGYAAMTEFLIKNGANPNLVAIEDSVNINAATLAIRNHHPKALAAILKFNYPQQTTLSIQSIEQTVTELTKPENNKAVLTENFIENLAIEALRNLSLETRKILLKKSLESESPEAVAKIKESGNGEIATYVKEFFEEAITTSNPKMLAELIKEFDIKTICEELERSASMSSSGHSESPSIKTKSIESTSLTNVVTNQFANKYLKMARDVDPNRENESAQAVEEIIKTNFCKPPKQKDWCIVM